MSARTGARACATLCCVAAVQIIVPGTLSAQASDRCPEVEWSRWYPAAAGLHFTYKICYRGVNQEFEWNWSNFSNESVSLAYRIFTREVDNCKAPAHEAIGSGHLSVPPNTRLDVPGGGFAEPGRQGRVHLCISRDWQNAVQRAIDSLDVGTRIRVSRTSTPNEQLAGALTSIGPNAVLFAESGSDSSTAGSESWIQLDDIAELAISRGIRNRATVGLLTGGIAGVLGGAAIGALTSGYSCETIDHPLYVINNSPARTRVCTGALPGKRAAIVGLISGAAGGALGYLIGSKMLKESWANAGPTWTLVRF